MYKSNHEGVYDENIDFLAESFVADMVIPENLHLVEDIDTVIDSLDVGEYITFDMYVMKYTHYIDKDDEESVHSLLGTIKEDMEEMLEDETLILLERFEVTVKVQDVEHNY